MDIDKEKNSLSERIKTLDKRLESNYTELMKQLTELSEIEDEVDRLELYELKYIIRGIRYRYARN